MKMFLAKVSTLLGLGAVLHGCDQPTALELPATQPYLGKSGAATQVAVLNRTAPLASGMGVTGTIGPAGGTLELKGAGVVAIFPANAVAAPVTITMTAVAGRPVAYTFEPHGLVFGQPVRVEVSLMGTAADGNRRLQDVLEAAYFPDGLGDAQTTGTATVTERMPVGFDATRSKAIFSVRHFSGYLLASGRR